MRVVQLNLAFDPTMREPRDLLGRYHTLTGWAEALSRGGAEVHVVQRFSSERALVQNNVDYTFVDDGREGTPRPWSVLPRVEMTVERLSPEVVHVNGLMFPGMAQRVRRSLRSALIVLQDHSGILPAKGVWPFQRIRQRRWRESFRGVDAVSFTARELATRWYPIGLPLETTVLQIPEASTDFAPIEPAAAREHTGMSGAPAVLWVGRLDANKDPLTMLDGFEHALQRIPAARLWVVTPFGELETLVRQRLARSAALQASTTILGPIAREKMAAYFSAADVFVSASHHEGSGYALIEAMACGALPCVTDIPSFRALTRGCGELWLPGDAVACGAALVRAAARATPDGRGAVRATFDGELSWDVVGRRTYNEYRQLLMARREARA